MNKNDLQTAWLLVALAFLPLKATAETEETAEPITAGPIAAEPTIAESINTQNLTAAQLIEDVLERTRGLSSYSELAMTCLLYTSPSPRDATLSRMPSSA